MRLPVSYETYNLQFDQMLVELIERTGQANKLRHAYHRFSQPAKIMRMQVGNQTAQFWVPKRRLQDDIEYFTEADQLRMFLQMLREDDVVWDVGANCGVYSIFAAQTVSAKGRVYCFEPQKRMLRILRVNRFINKLDRVVQIVPLGLGDRTGTTSFYESAGAMGTHSLVQRFGDYPSKDKPIEIQLSRGDELVSSRGFAVPTVVKIDVEGAEFAVCEGLRDLMTKNPPRLIFIEVHPHLLPDFQSSPDELSRLLTDYGYQLTNAGSRGSEDYWAATRTAA